jgi:hypothetical protein
VLLPVAGLVILAVLCAQPSEHKVTVQRTDIPLAARS